MPGYLYLTAVGLSLTLALVLTPCVRGLAVRWGRVARPREDRWHARPTALLGGVAIFAALVLGWVPLALYAGWQSFGLPYLPLVLCATGMFALGLADDLLNLAPHHKLAGQVVLAAVFVFFGGRLAWTQWETVNLLLSLLWVVGLTNAFNLLDNMDGLAAGVALIGTVGVALYLVERGPAPATILLACVFAGALLGFLVYNFNPASIFMGDAGSLLIGFWLAALSLSACPAPREGGGFLNVLSVIAVPVFMLFIPILDTGFVSLMRRLFRRRISQGGRDHSSHRLVAIGFSERKAVIVLYAFAAAAGVLAFAIDRLPLGISLALMTLFLLLVLFFWLYLARVKVYPEASILDARASGRGTLVRMRLGSWKKLGQMLLDVVLVALAYYLGYLLRFEGAPGPNFDFFLHSLPILLACQILGFHLFGIYRGVWHSVGLRDLVGYIKAVTAATVVTILILLFAYRFISFSRAVFAIYWILMLLFVSLTRLSFRILDENVRRGAPRGRPALIYGAGVGGMLTLKEIENNPDLELTLVGFVDDDPNLRRRRIKGYPVLGTGGDVPDLVARHGIQEVIVSFRQQGAEKKEELARLSRARGLEVTVRRMRLTLD